MSDKKKDNIAEVEVVTDINISEEPKEETNDEKKVKLKKENKPKKEKKPLDKKAKRKRRRIIIFSIIGVVIVLIVVSSLLGGNGAQAIVTTTNAEIGEIEQTIKTSGTVSTDKTKNYFSEVNVKIGDVVVSTGDAVKAGDVLIAYDADELAKEKQLAELNIQSTEGNYNNSVQSNNETLGDLGEASTNLPVLEQQIADTEAYITNLENKIAKKKTDLAHEGALLQISLIDWKDHPDSDEYENLQKLVQLNSFEQSNNKEIKGWEDELKVYNDMLADYKEYRSEMKSQKNSSEAGRMTAGAKEELEATNQSKSIEANDTLENLAAVENGITAEFDGVVTEMNAVEGSAVAVGTQLLKLESTQDVLIKISVTKYDLDKIALGQKVKIVIGGLEYEGEVAKINKMAELNNNGAAVVGADVKIANPDSNIILGVEAKVEISTATEKNAVIVPVGAVNVDPEGEFVYVVENNILIKKPVVTGISSDSMIQVVEGLTEGEQLVTEVTTALTEGMTVAAMPQ